MKIDGNVCKFNPDNETYYKQLECRSNVDYPGVFAVQISGNLKTHCQTESKIFMWFYQITLMPMWHQIFFTK